MFNIIAFKYAYLLAVDAEAALGLACRFPTSLRMVLTLAQPSTSDSLLLLYSEFSNSSVQHIHVLNVYYNLLWYGSKNNLECSTRIEPMSKSSTLKLH